jgi:hypothetical protein
MSGLLERMALCLFALAFVAIAFAATPPRLTLTRRGEPSATIVIDKTPTRSAQFAALELQWHVREISGATLPIVRGDAPTSGVRILVGDSPAAAALGLRGRDLPAREYVLRFLPDTLVLLGRDADDRGEVRYGASDLTAHTTWPSFYEDRATCFAVYDFLERFCGVRWFNPSAIGMACPWHRTLTVSGADVRRQPDFRYSDFGGNFLAGNAEAYGVDGSPLWDGDLPGAAPHRDAINRLAWGDENASVLARRQACRLFLHRMRAGGEKFAANHSFYGYYQRFWEKSPAAPDEFVERRPDYFAKGQQGMPNQMCYTDSGFIAQVVQDARDFFDGRGKHVGAQAMGDFFALVPMDNGDWCRCPACQAELNQAELSNPCFNTGYASDYFFGFANKVAREIRKSHPDKYIAALAYAQYAYYPVRVRLEPNIAVMLCLALRNNFDTVGIANERKVLDSWADREKNRPLYAWLYYCFPQEVATNGRWHCFPGYFAHTVDQWFKTFHRDRIRGAFFCGFGGDVEAYVTFKLMDDSSQSIDALLDDYFTRYYGHAAAPMKELYLAMEETYSNPASYPPHFVLRHQTQQVAWESLGTEARMAAFARLMDQARAAAVTDVEKERVALFDEMYWSYMVAGRRQYVDRQAMPVPRATVPLIPRIADGDPARVDWRQAAALADFFKHGGTEPAPRKLEARLAHDGERLYLQFTDPVAPKSLVANATVCPFDDWELFLARDRAQPYRQIMVGPTGIFAALTHGEVNWRMNVPWADTGLKVAGDATAADKWVLRLSIPLANLVQGGVKPGETFHMNFVRVTSPNVTGTGGLGIDCWSPMSTVHEADRLGELTLAAN